LTQRAVEFLRGDTVILKARGRWPTATLEDLQRLMPGAVGLTGQGRPSTMIPEDLRPAEGRALCIYGDDILNAPVLLIDDIVDSGWTPQ
jgi:hypothetical protein